MGLVGAPAPLDPHKQWRKKKISPLNPFLNLPLGTRITTVIADLTKVANDIWKRTKRGVVVWSLPSGVLIIR